MSVSLTAVQSHFVCVCCTITCLSNSANCRIYCNLLINGSEISSSDLLSNDDAYMGRRERGRSVNDRNGWYGSSILWNNAQVCHHRCNLPGSPHALITKIFKSQLQSPRVTAFLIILSTFKLNDPLFILHYLGSNRLHSQIKIVLYMKTDIPARKLKVKLLKSI